LEELRDSFEEYFWQIPRSLLHDAKEAKNLLLAFAKVIFKMESTAKTRLTATWDDFVSHKFANLLTSAASGGKAEVILKDLSSFWQTDLQVIRDGVVPAFPPEFPVLDHFALIYHRNIYGILQHLGVRTGGLITPGDILGILAWMRTYYSTMSMTFGFGEESLEPRLLGDREEILIKFYVDQSQEKLSTWTNNVLTNEIKIFTDRKSLPDLDADDQYLTPAAVDVYQIIKQNIETAFSSKTPALIAAVINAAVVSVSDFQKGLQRTLQNETSKFLDPQMQRQCAPNFEQYVQMLGNSALCWVKFMNDLADDLEQQITESLGGASMELSAALKNLRKVNESFMNIAKDSVDVLVKVIMLATAPAYGSLFLEEWSDYSNSIDSISATFEDFFTDYAQHFNDFLLKRLAAQVLEAHLLAYVEAMRNKAVRFKQPPIDGFSRDSLAIMKFFVKGGWREERRVEKAFEPLNRLFALLNSSPRLIFMDAAALIKLCPDFPMPILEEIIAKRTDLDKSTLKKELFETLREKSREERAAAPDIVSIFSKLKIKK
jgi:exocyst complex component 3